VFEERVGDDEVVAFTELGELLAIAVPSASTELAFALRVESM
jgi:hypothetical protein